VIHREGYPYVIAPAVVGGLLLAFRRKGLALSALSLSVLNALFFRNPDRQGVLNADYVFSPADGKIVRVSVERIPQWWDGPLYRVGIFMRLWDVHVNRSPITGRVINTAYISGKKGLAFADHAFERNEKQIYLIEREDGLPVYVIQIAGLVARRIKSFVLPGDEVLQGEVLGLIKFGSRVELFFPAERAELLIREGHRVFAGETPVARIPLER